MNITPLIEKLRHNFADIERRMSDPAIFDNRQEYEKLSREHQRLSDLLSRDDELMKLKSELGANKEMLSDENDEEFRMMIETDIKKLEQDIKRLDAAVLSLIVPDNEIDCRNTIVEIRPAAGGDEAALFAGDLFRLYTKFAERMRWRTEVFHIQGSALGGIKEVAFSLEGKNVYRFMKLESGVHRVQRVPTTEASGRIHTSTVTVAVLPEAKDVEIDIKPDDLRIDVFRSSGPGGQSVNTTDSAVRITHIPTGMSVASQQEKSQHRNKEIAMRILRSRILEAKQREEAEKHAVERRTQIGTGDRSERIRTYNYPQNRVTDHRYGVSIYNLPEFLEGDISGFLEEIIALENAKQLEEELNEAHNFGNEIRDEIAR
jgi:peptide chain release factor 1